MAGWHHGLDGRESEWTLGVGDGQGGLACCDSWGHKESDTTARLKWTELNCLTDPAHWRLILLSDPSPPFQRTLKVARSTLPLSSSPTPGAYSNSCPLSQWCHPTISSSVIHPLLPPSIFPSIRSFQMSQLFASGGQSIGVSASTSILPMNTQDWSPLE